VALRIDTPVGEGTVTSSATTYEGMNPGRCDVPGPVEGDAVARGFVKVANAITLEFFP
jgi:hypothetical protein